MLVNNVLDYDYMNASVNLLQCLELAMCNAKDKMSHIDTRLHLIDAYDVMFNNRNISNNDPVELVFGPMLKRESEDTSSYTVLGDLINDYTEYSINKIFGLTFKDYLDLDTYSLETIKKTAMILSKQIEKAESDAVNKMHQLTAEAKKGMNAHAQ